MSISIRSPRDFCAGLIFLFFGALAAYIARDYPMGSAVRMGPGYFPYLLGILLALLGMVICIKSLMIHGERIESASLRALAVTGPERSPVLAELPTVSEVGLPGFSITSWFGLYAPSGTSPQIIGRLNREVNRALANAQIRRRLTDQGIEPAGGTPGQFADFMQAELVKWGKIVRESGARVE